VKKKRNERDAIDGSVDVDDGHLSHRISALEMAGKNVLGV